MKQSSLFEMAHVCHRVFDAHGLSVDETNSVTEFEDRMAVVGKKPNQVPFDASRHILPRHRISAVLLQHDGKDIGGVISRSLDLGDRPLCDLLDDEAAVLYGSLRPRRLTSPTAKQISGNVAYVGEMLFKENRTNPDDHWRNRPALTAAMVRYIQCVSFSQWRCNWVYGIIKQVEVEQKGRVTQYGFSIVEPNLQSWADVGDPRRDSAEYLVANNRAQFAHIISASIREPNVYFPGFSNL